MRQILVMITGFALVYGVLSCGALPLGSGVVDNGNKPTPPKTKEAETSQGDTNSENPKAGGIGSMIQLDVLAKYQISVEGKGWKSETQLNGLQQVSKDGVKIIFREVEDFCDVDPKIYDLIDVYSCSSSKSVIDPRDGSFIEATFEEKTPEIEDIIKSFRVKQ